MDYMDPMSSVLKKADKLNLSLSLSDCVFVTWLMSLLFISFNFFYEAFQMDSEVDPLNNIHCS